VPSAALGLLASLRRTPFERRFFSADALASIVTTAKLALIPSIVTMTGSPIGPREDDLKRLTFAAAAVTASSQSRRQRSARIRRMHADWD
jgi:hypothetical protein